jgi:hypothetical protein
MLKLAIASMLSVVLAITVACTKKSAANPVIVEIPAGFSGNFVLEMGVRDAAPLARQGDAYVLAVPRNGRAQTSTLLNNARVTCKNSSDGQVWGFSQRVFSTGDGISIGGRIEFFVGTQKDFDAEQQKKNKSGGFLSLKASFTAA